MPSTLTVRPDRNPVPLILIGVPPSVDPMFGSNSLMTGPVVTTYAYPPGTLARA